MIRGFDFLVAVIGLFGISEILLTIEEGLAFKGQKARIDLKVVLRTWAELPRHWVIALRSAADRLLDGHHAGRRHPRLLHELRRRPAHVAADGKDFGTGRIEGVIAPETAAHAAGTSAAPAHAGARRARLADRRGAARRPASCGASSPGRCCSWSRRSSSGA